MKYRYTYLGDKITDKKFIGAQCNPVRRTDGKCVVGKSPRNQLVQFEDGTVCVVLARQLRVNKVYEVFAGSFHIGTYETYVQAEMEADMHERHYGDACEIVIKKEQ